MLLVKFQFKVEVPMLAHIIEMMCAMPYVWGLPYKLWTQSKMLHVMLTFLGLFTSSNIEVHFYPWKA